MKRRIVYFIVALFVTGAARADQTVQSVQQALKDQGFYYGNVTRSTGRRSTNTTKSTFARVRLLPGAVTPAQGWGAHAFRVLVAAFRRNELPPEPCFHAK